MPVVPVRVLLPVAGEWRLLRRLFRSSLLAFRWFGIYLDLQSAQQIAQHPKMESIGSIGSITFGIFGGPGRLRNVGRRFMVQSFDSRSSCDLSGLA